ncbi:MAG: exodeoxyribonuclease VII large subunit [Chloroflexota bacterium]|nr:exodeoxyribonuclease VII large subunit [Chloroflexota bacterium]MDE2886495.1 exodeoxyribonuclease VII large subunit [Chloroflexota bacterium]
MQVYSVSQITEYIRTILDRDVYLSNVWVTGEVSNLFASAAGHRYFTLKNSEHQLKSVHFSGYYGGEHVVNGAQVIAHGRVSFYSNRGETQLYADSVVPAGEGALAAEFERLRAKLETEGLFDPARKRTLPPFPRRIGVVTSAQGAVIHDIQTVLSARYPLCELVLCDASVQGDEAPAELTDAIRALNRLADVDVIIVARGGGSLEDLRAFNAEEVARAIYASRIPVVSAVGHESDYTIADFVADLRAPTPSAAAAAVAPDVRALSDEVASLTSRSGNAIAYYTAQRTNEIGALVARMQRHLPDTAMHRQRVDELLERAYTGFDTFIRLRREQTDSLRTTLNALDPSSILRRGYAMVTSVRDGSAVTSASNVVPGDLVRATLHDGELEAMVTARK